MEGRTGSRGPQKLTSKGQTTRGRILRQAAELIYARGVRATNNELLRRAAGVSGSQLTHYFPDKESLVLASAALAAAAPRFVTLARRE